MVVEAVMMAVVEPGSALVTVAAVRCELRLFRGACPALHAHAYCLSDYTPRSSSAFFLLSHPASFSFLNYISSFSLLCFVERKNFFFMFCMGEEHFFIQFK
jgi:hypothetical protein